MPTPVCSNMPSPDPALNIPVQQAISDYDAGLHYCISGTQNYDVNDIEQATTFLHQGNMYLHTAIDILECDMSNSPVLTG